jgi:hypothetical protein
MEALDVAPIAVDLIVFVVQPHVRLAAAAGRVVIEPADSRHIDTNAGGSGRSWGPRFGTSWEACSKTESGAGYKCNIAE